MDELMFDPEEGDNVSKERALSIFQRCKDTNTYMVKMKNYHQYVLIQEYI